MAAIASSDVSYSQVAGSAKASPSDPAKRAQYEITFGNGALTYPAGGIPLLKGKLGAPSNMQEFIIMEADADDGYVYKYDKSAEKIRAYYVPDLDGDAASAAPLDELATDEAPAATTLIVIVQGY